MDKPVDLMTEVGWQVFLDQHGCGDLVPEGLQELNLFERADALLEAAEQCRINGNNDRLNRLFTSAQELIDRYRADITNQADCFNFTRLLCTTATLLTNIGGKSNIANALSVYNEAIELRRSLDLSVPKFCDGLAQSLDDMVFLLEEIGGDENCLASLSAVSESIKIRRNLDMSVHGYSDNLALSLYNMAFLLNKMGGKENVVAALTAIGEAIDLYLCQDLSVPKYRNLLAERFNDKAYLLDKLGGILNHLSSLSAYGEAIELRRGLDVSVPEYCNGLAHSLHNKAFMLDKLGGNEVHLEALSAVGEAIKLRRSLDLSVPEYCNALSSSLYLKSVMLSKIDRDENCLQALSAYSEAIELRRGLDVSVSEFRNELAKCLENKAILLAKLSGNENHLEVLSNISEAVELRRGLDLSVPEYCNDLASNLNNKAILLAKLSGNEKHLKVLSDISEAVELRRGLDLSVPEYCKGLALSLYSMAMFLTEIDRVGNYEAAMSAHIEAIELRRSLDLSVPEHRYCLSLSLQSMAKLLTEIDREKNPAVAISAYHEAIELRRSLDLSVPMYRNELALCLYDMAEFITKIGRDDNLNVALAAYNETIELRRGMDLSVHDCRKSLALSLLRKADLLTKIGSDENLVIALSTYNEAIEHCSGLNLSVSVCRKLLAKCLIHKTNLLEKLCGQENTLAALAANEEAIELCRGLDLFKSECRELFAESLTQKAILLTKLGGQANLLNALQVYEEAYQLLEPLINLGTSFDPPSAKNFCWLCWNYTKLLIIIERWEDAAEIVDTSLVFLRNLEKLGYAREKQNRRVIFKLALRVYLGAGQPHFIPEIIFEELAPENPGSAWDMPEMYRIAADALRQALHVLLGQKPIIGKYVKDIWDAYARLVKLSSLCFAGSAESACQRALYAESRGDTNTALAVLDSYVERRSLDFQGRMVRAGYHVRQGNREKALADYEEAMRLVGIAAREPSEVAIEDICLIAETWARIKVEARLNGVAGNSDFDVTLRQVFDPVIISLADLPGKLWPQKDSWKNAVKTVLNERVLPKIQEARSQLNEADKNKARAEGARAFNERTVALLSQIAVVVGSNLPRSLADFVQYLFAIIAEANTYNLDREDNPDLVDHMVSAGVMKAMDSLNLDEIPGAIQELEQLMGKQVYEDLNDREKRYLAVALHCSSKPEVEKFTALELGCAVEHALQERLYRPLQIHHAQMGTQPAAPHSNYTDRVAKLYAYLSNDKNSASVMLGPQVIAFNKAASRVGGLDQEEKDLVSELVAWLRPNPGVLSSVSPVIAKERRAKLAALSELRNDVAHGKEPQPTSAAIMQAWHDTVVDRDVAFFRYFPAIFREPEKC